MLKVCALAVVGSLLISASAPVITQAGLVVRSAANPKLAIRVADAFAPLPAVTLPLESTDVDRRVFVDADTSKTVQRLVVLQFEHVRSGATFKCVYPPKPPFLFGGETYRLGTYVYDDAKGSADAPTREAAVTRVAVTQQGYALPRLFRTARLARVADPDGTSEIIIFYIENADGQYPAGTLQGADEDGDLVLKGGDADSLLKRMSLAISVVRDAGDQNGLRAHSFALPLPAESLGRR
jgi:hypothetical protein